MRFSYDPAVDILMVCLKDLKEGETVANCVEIAEGIFMDIDEHGNPIDFEILDASHRFGKDAVAKHDLNTNLLTLSEAAERCGLSAETLKIQARAGRLRAQKVGRNWVTTKSWLRSYLIDRRYNAKKTAELS